MLFEGAPIEKNGGIKFALFPNRTGYSRNVDETSEFYTKGLKKDSKDTVVCSVHLESGCFDPAYDLKKSMGLKTRRGLVKGSVSITFVRSQPKTIENEYKRVHREQVWISFRQMGKTES